MVYDSPHYISKAANYLIYESLIETVKASLTALSLLIYVFEKLSIFVFDLWFGTYACLFVSAVDGSINVATNVTEKLVNLTNTTVHSIANELDDGLQDISDVINNIIKVANKIEDFFTSDSSNSNNASDSINDVNLTITKLSDFYISSDINEKLQNLSDNTPTFTELKNKTNYWISEPFEYVRNKITTINLTESLGSNNSVLSLDKMYTIPLYNNGSSVNTDNDYCTQNIVPEFNKIFDEFTKIIKIINIIIIILLVICAVAALIPEMWKEVIFWKKLKKLNTRVDHNIEIKGRILDDKMGLNSGTNNNVNGDNVSATAYMSSSSTITNPFKDESYPSTAGSSESDNIETYTNVFNIWQYRLSKVLLSNKKTSKISNIKVKWLVQYIFSTRALIILGISLLGLACCIIQYIILHVIDKHLQNSGSSDHGNTTTTILQNKIGTAVQKSLIIWSNNTNSYIETVEQQFNKQLFGYVEETTSSLNSTINKVITEMDSIIAKAFNNTMLYNPMKTIVGCVIENKLYAIEDGITWVHDKCQINIPTIDPNNIIKQINNNDSTSSSALSDAVAKFKVELQKLVANYKSSVNVELAISLILFGIWLLQIPIGLMIFNMKTKDLSPSLLKKLNWRKHGNS
ncbi:pheromone-regulated protein PRM1 SCDLUD_003872 [Saccharomycodes ludwigii]|uniref:pheromone-regulated protein PRM1 n=1 Tax=Saccharomycodes ludwigii TaxID=36035 RepID=UPI001E8C1768|nr:hypothetical protein SCDLUD_003872 [Saccharomycodes ludwigii]KAH3899592.1 hypothetical protein SCDLUD_003872 [Saccharomycodes ludwigii]